MWISYNPVINWQTVQVVSCFSPNDSWFIQTQVTQRAFVCTACLLAFIHAVQKASSDMCCTWYFIATSLSSLLQPEGEQFLWQPPSNPSLCWYYCCIYGICVCLGWEHKPEFEWMVYWLLAWTPLQKALLLSCQGEQRLKHFLLTFPCGF